MSRRAALICLLLGLAAVAVVLILAPSRSVICLPDGGELRLVAVTHGTVHQYLGGGWRNRLLRLLPDKIGRRFRPRGASIATASTNVVFWFERSGGELPVMTLRDADGLEFGQQSCSISTGTGTVGDWIEGVGFSVVPRREKELHLRLYARGSGNEAGRFQGEFNVPNPLHGNHPAWTADPYPITRETNGVAVTLRELNAGVRWRGLMEEVVPGDGTDVGVRAVFDIAENGVPTDAWAPIGIETSDATGNQVQHQGWKGKFEDGRHMVHYRWGLWPSESAWRLKVQVARRPGFGADELWTVNGLPLAAGLIAGPDCHADLQGASLELHRVEPQHFQPGRWTIHVRVQPFRDDFRLDLVRVTDDRGRLVPRTGESGSMGHHTFDLKTEPDAESLNLTFALHPRCYVEFVAKPELLHGTNVVTTSSSITTRKELQ